VGEHKITIELTDRYGGFSVQEFRFHLKELPLSELKPASDVSDRIDQIINEATSWAKVVSQQQKSFLLEKSLKLKTSRALILEY
jgi:hypothetical protein